LFASKKDVDGRNKCGHDAAGDVLDSSWPAKSAKRVFMQKVPAIHVFLAFLDRRLTLITLNPNPDSSPFT
jgi:hypothetical protein